MTRLRLILAPTYEQHSRLQPGDCWYAVAAPGGGWLEFADSPFPLKVVGTSEFAFDIAERHAARCPAFVVLPTRAIFGLMQPQITRIDKPPFIQAGPGWDITGELPNMTVSPSINYDPGGTYAWHGFLQNGELR